MKCLVLDAMGVIFSAADDVADFRVRVGLDENLEDEYLASFTLSHGLTDLLSLARDRSLPVWCLSNDVGRWSLKLRHRFHIEPLLAGSIISGDVGLRKPDADIYRILLRQSGYEAADLLFVDDREKNRHAAQALGIDSPPFDAHTGFEILLKQFESGSRA